MNAIRVQSKQGELLHEIVRREHYEELGVFTET